MRESAHDAALHNRQKRKGKTTCSRLVKASNGWLFVLTGIGPCVFPTPRHRFKNISTLFIALVPVSLLLVFVAGVILILHGAGLV